MYLEPVVILVKPTCSCFSDQKTAMRQDSWIRALSLEGGVHDCECKEEDGYFSWLITYLVGPAVRGT